EPRRKCFASRHRTIVPVDVLAKRVQPGPRPVPAHGVRRRTRCERVPLPISIFDWRARCAPILRITKKYIMQKIIVLTLALAAGIAASAAAQSKLTVITATEDLAAIGREIGGDHVAIESIARGYQDPHYVEAKPSFILKLQKADLLVVVGRELEIGWLPPLIQQSRNAKIQPGSGGYLDASLNAAILEIPTGQVTRAMGDVHPLGNPHYWLDPDNGKRIAKSIADKLSELRPNDRAYFQQQLASFTM